MFRPAPTDSKAVGPVSKTVMQDRLGAVLPVDQKQPNVLLLATSNSNHGFSSQYTALVNFVPGSVLIANRRSEPNGVFERVVTAFLSKSAFSRWYRLSSFDVEWRAWRAICGGGFSGLVHFMWAERDWGFLDLFPGSHKAPLCATFHCCPDNLPLVVPNSNRLSRLSAVILMSEIQKPYFLSHGVEPDKIHVIHHGVDCRYFYPLPVRSRKDFTVITVGGYRRNFPLLRELCISLSWNADISFKIVGPKTSKSFFDDLTNVEFFTEVEETKLLELYQNACCFVMAAEAATANNAILEALACGLPIVSEDVGGIGEYTGLDCAILCKPQSVEALMKGILKLHEQPELRLRMSALARQRAESWIGQSWLKRRLASTRRCSLAWRVAANYRREYGVLRF
jgi:glycosyltransferase involved in cell wall biosynthesis